MQDYGLPLSTVQLMQRARLFKDPTVSAIGFFIEQIAALLLAQVLFNLYTEYRRTVCDVDLLNSTLFKWWPYLEFRDKFNVKKLSDYACGLTFERQTSLMTTLSKHFIVIDKIRKVRTR